MIDDATVRAIAAEMDIPIDQVRTTLADAERKPGVTDPIALGKSWLRSQAKALKAPAAAPRRVEPQFIGWHASGSLIHSAVPVTNPQTDFARWLIRETRDQLLTPADVVRLIARQPEAVHRAIGLDTLSAWAHHAHYDANGTPINAPCTVSCWGALSASSSLAEAIRSWGGWSPWLRDENAWQGILQREAARNGNAA
jgi:hypothetical protein